MIPVDPPRKTLRGKLQSKVYCHLPNVKDYPSSRKIAEVFRLKFYWTAEPCSRGHPGLRWTSSGECPACRRVLASRAGAPFVAGRRQRREAVTRARTAALGAGEATYESWPGCKHGHSAVRYAKTGQCVGCAAVRSRRQYAASKARNP